MMATCRECGHQVSDQALACPGCGAPFPARPRWNGFGFEYRSKTTLVGIPLVHVSFKYRANRRPVVAVGVLAIGQFACGVFTISQFGVGLVSLSQFTVAGIAVAQFGIAASLVAAQIGLYLMEGHGMLVYGIPALLGLR